MAKLVPGRVKLADLARLYWKDADAELDGSCRDGVERSAAVIERSASGKRAVYGVNTGFGKLAGVRIPPADIYALQRNLIRSHCGGVGDDTPNSVVKMMMALKLVSLGRGASGVRWELIKLLQETLIRGVIPVVPQQGSVGASGDLAPLAHMSAVLMGEGEAKFCGSRMPGAAALAAVGLVPIELGPKEGLALINGTQFSTAYALISLLEGWRAAENSLIASALTTDAIMGTPEPFRPEVHLLRGHPGQTEAAACLRALLDGSEIRESHRTGDQRVQDPYCVRCQPQVTGASMDLIRQAACVLEIEANAVTDNPLVSPEGEILSGGNFHAEPVAFAADQIALALAEIGAISQRRIALMVDPALSHDLPAFLTAEPGLNSGFMLVEIASAALMSENKQRANPCSTDSTPTSANQEDHVAMAAHGARRLVEMNANLARIIAIEFMCASQGIEFRAPLRTSPPLERVVKRLRRDVSALKGDRPLAADIEIVAKQVRSRELVEAAGVDCLPELRNEMVAEAAV